MVERESCRLIGFLLCVALALSAGGMAGCKKSDDATDAFEETVGTPDAARQADIEPADVRGTSDDKADPGDALPDGEVGPEPADVLIPDDGEGEPETTLPDAGPDVIGDDGGGEEDVAPEIVTPCTPGESCDDQDPCTELDVCTDDGKCGGKPVFCDDGNDCTEDMCEPKEGCKFSAIEGPCDDGNPCTDADECINGQCQAGEELCQCYANEDCAEYEDGNLCNGTLLCNLEIMPHQCQVDMATKVDCSIFGPDECLLYECVPETGECEAIPTDQEWGCDDGDPCTVDDKCGNGMCVGTPVEACGLGEPCDADGDCHQGLFCLDFVTGGYCAKDDCEALGCPDGGFCYKALANELPVCLKSCQVDDDCRVDEGYGCTPFGACWCGEEMCESGQPACIGDLAGTCNWCGSALEPGPINCADQDLFCYEGQCAVCQPACDGKECGPDGCGETCGDCPGQSECDLDSGQCDCGCPGTGEQVCDSATGITYQNSCEAECMDVLDWIPGKCPNCPDSCLPVEQVSGDMCSQSHDTFPSFCDLKCDIGVPDCVSVDECPQLGYEGTCTDQCWVAESEPKEVGDIVGDFLCVDLNDNSAGYDTAVSKTMLKELVWIAYFGSCT